MKIQKRQLVNEVLNATTHGIGIIFSIIATILLIIKAHLQADPKGMGVYLIYGITLIGLYLCSTLFHSLYFTRAKRLFQIFDHCSINFLIAGTYTPYCLLVIKGKTGIILLSCVWILAIFCILYHILAKKRKQWIETCSYILMGWLCLFCFQPLVQNLGTKGLTLLFWGGVAFSLGAVFYSLQKINYMHVIWHLFVLLGTILMYLSIYWYI